MSFLFFLNLNNFPVVYEHIIILYEQLLQVYEVIRKIHKQILYIKIISCYILFKYTMNIAIYVPKHIFNLLLYTSYF